jgi:biopolymer transport protein TolQ
MISLMGNALWQLIKQSDFIAKLVLLALLVMSILCWSIFIYKHTYFKTKKKQLENALARLKSLHSIEQLLELASDYSGTLPGLFLSRNLTYLKGILEINKERGSITLNEHQWNLVQQNMAQSIDDMLYQEESGITVLSTCASVSTLLGLFGTVWGLIHAFIGIAEKQSADIVTVAPGIAEALITTLAGLIIAIPALIMVNYASNQLRYLENKLFGMAERTNVILQRLFVR